MINRTVLVGRLTRDPELKYTNSGRAVASFNIAVNRQFTNSQGEREADFINCVIWNKTAENFCNFTRKGSLVGIDGRIQTRSYENTEGTRIYVTEVVADRFSLLESKPKSEAGTDEQGGQPSQNNNYQKPNSNPNDPFANGGQSIDINDDDLPF
ncbi:single-stranded DNA-binding protein [Pediococcus pentosaceus]|jgi:single-strand DNA-binding protein|uniref:single-stranded DNA-binding protein n=1 Tax=Pediococcus pentosaceus TaxID=1255 RepID=UPI0022E1BE7A|nr:single-stranded DNA-binding protein [Pediococcus pentosaceus]